MTALRGLGVHAAQLQSLTALAVLVVVLSVSTESFMSVENGVNVLRQISVNLCLSIGMTLVILTGGIDLSVGSVLALAGAVAAGLVKEAIPLPALGYALEFTAAGAIVAGVAVGLACGAFNGAMVTLFGLPPFVATLGMLSIARGLTLLWTGARPITGLGEVFETIGSGVWLGLPVMAWVVGGLAVLFAVVTRRTRFGRHLYAVGGSERAAALSGVRVGFVKLWAYTLSGALAGVAGVLLAARLDSGTPQAGIAFELDSIAAVVIGGASLAGGRGTIFGAVIGCLIIGVLNNGLVLLGVSSVWQQVIKGVVILAAVAIDRAANRERC
ncbi:ABC transporter permease [Botrimarina sp.]|uniref:ABC transporter permease n=1 Tax=Botrimarina sp. TaxID=2795802 RepID=UPI0032ECB5DB